MNDSVKPNEVVGMDFISSLDGRYLLVIVDYLPRRAKLNVCKKANGESVMGGCNAGHKSVALLSA